MKKDLKYWKQQQCAQREARPEKIKHDIWEQAGPGILRAPDGRERCTPAEMLRRKSILLQRAWPNSLCAACNQPLESYEGTDLGYIESKGIGGGKHNDAMSNLCLEHRRCNLDQGSLSLADYKAKKGYDVNG